MLSQPSFEATLDAQKAAQLHPTAGHTFLLEVLFLLIPVTLPLLVHLLDVLLRILLISFFILCGTVAELSTWFVFSLLISLGTLSTNTPSVLMTHKSTSVFQYLLLLVLKS